jgi:N-acetyl-gamma-glutamylphosphate reductase
MQTKNNKKDVSPQRPESQWLIQDSVEMLFSRLAKHVGVGMRRSFSSGIDNVKVGLVGARGYVGGELLRILACHPQLELVAASSRALAGTKVRDYAALQITEGNVGKGESGTSGDANSQVSGISEELSFELVDADELGVVTVDLGVDVWVLALPNGHAEAYVAALDHAVASGHLNESDMPLIIDLSYDMRGRCVAPLTEPAAIEVTDWVYGLPERKGARAQLQKARRIANPGCYATAVQLCVLPFSDTGMLSGGYTPTAFGVSGYSGAGTSKPREEWSTNLADNLIPYTLTNHGHEYEVSQQLGTSINFMPHVGAHFRGITLTLTLELARPLIDTPLDEDISKHSKQDIEVMKGAKEAAKAAMHVRNHLAPALALASPSLAHPHSLACSCHTHSLACSCLHFYMHLAYRRGLFWLRAADPSAASYSRRTLGEQHRG